MNATTDEFVAILPEILYFGTPVAIISSLNRNGTTNLAAMSSFWAQGYYGKGAHLGKSFRARDN
jgi:flavin reductase (DIM6/NTAB) family NADH-FMN oxidoreductase RutF